MSTKQSSHRPITMTQIIRRARKALREMPKTEKIDVMVEAGVMISEQADRANQRLLELAEQARAEAEAASATITPTGDEA